MEMWKDALAFCCAALEGKTNSNILIQTPCEKSLRMPLCANFWFRIAAYQWPYAVMEAIKDNVKFIQSIMRS
jgi:hypothetical protein